MITFGVLGSLTVHRDGCPAPIDAALLRRLLAILICRAGSAVSAAALAEELWDGRPPLRVRKVLQVYVHRLRRLLGDPARILHGSGGYTLLVEADDVDKIRFINLVTQARAARRESQLERASKLYHEALDLWRGEPYADIPTGPLLAADISALAELHVRVREENITVGLDLGRHTEHVTELAALTKAYPFQEGLRACFMLALHRCGRRAEALDVFRQTRELLVEQLGVEPDLPLQWLHQAILRGDPRLARLAAADLHQLGDPVPAAPSSGVPASEPPGSALAPGVATPAQLPADSPSFVGRDDELAALDDCLRAAGAPPQSVGIAAVTGTAGIGKTTLAVHWAHHVADQFPDGQLYVNLRGFERLDRPMHPSEAIRSFLEALAVPAQHIPTTVDAQAALYRSVLAGRRILVVLDNAQDAEQVRPLLPGSPGSFALVTSRNRLTGLVATTEAQVMRLELLSATDARTMLARRLGPDRITAEPAAVERIVDCCAGLPLALAVVAARLITNPALTLISLAGDLTDAAARLDALTVDEPTSDVRSVFSWSYRGLSPQAATMFRLMGSHPGAEFSLDAVANLAGIVAPQATAVVSELIRAHLVWELRPGRYGLHDLLQAYAAELSQQLDDADVRSAAVGRVLDHYLHSAYRADRQLYPHRHPISLTQPPIEITCAEVGDPNAALAWLAAEQHNLIAAIEMAVRAGCDTQAWQLAWSMETFLLRRGFWHDVIAIHEMGLAAAQRLDDAAAEAMMRFGLGVANTTLDRFDEAHSHYERMLQLLRAAGDHEALAHGHLNRSVTYGHEGRNEDALEQAQLSLAIFNSIEHRAGQAKSLNTVGWYQTLLGQYEQALASCRRAIAIARRVGDRSGQALTWDSLGYVHHQLGHHRQAATCYRRSVEIFRSLSDPYRQFTVLDHLGDALLAAGDRDAAATAWRDALTLGEHTKHLNTDPVRVKLAGLP